MKTTGVPVIDAYYGKIDAAVNYIYIMTGAQLPENLEQEIIEAIRSEDPMNYSRLSIKYKIPVEKIMEIVALSRAKERYETSNDEIPDLLDQLSLNAVKDHEIAESKKIMNERIRLLELAFLDLFGMMQVFLTDDKVKEQIIVDRPKLQKMDSIEFEDYIRRLNRDISINIDCGGSCTAEKAKELYDRPLDELIIKEDLVRLIAKIPQTQTPSKPVS